MNKSETQTIFVNALIHNAEQRVLLVRRAHDDHFLPGYLELPGGRVGVGEDLEHALTRKATQELGIRVAQPFYYTSLARVDRRGPYVRIVFEVAYSGQEEIKLSGRHAGFEWFNLADLKSEDVTADARAILDQYLGKAGQNSVDEKTTLIVHTDGGSRGNPGPSASGFVINDQTGRELESGGAYIGITTNNQAEYTAVALALKAAQRHAGLDDALLFNIDSLLVVNQLNGLYKVKNRELWPINQEIRELMKKFGRVQFRHIPREENTIADGKVNDILDQHAKM